MRVGGVRSSDLAADAGDAFKTFTDAIELIPEVEECHLVSGEFDFLVKGG